jgi:hypothetical protein
MKDLTPLIESSSSARGRELLRAARADGPRPGSSQRALVALGVAAGTSAATASAAAAAAASSAKVGVGGAVGMASASLPTLAAKWLLVGTLGGLALASGAQLVVSEARPSARPTRGAEGSHAPASERARSTVAPQLVPSGEAATVAPAANAEPALGVLRAPDRQASAPARLGASLNGALQPPTAPSQAAFDTPEHKLLHDVALLDAARRALRSGDAGAALGQLDRYEQARQTHTLDQEAQLLRIDALLSSGQRDMARKLASQYLAVHPSDAHSARLRALLAD